MNDAQIKHLVNRFLGWKLPENFAPDAGISVKKTFNEHTAHPQKYDPSGTNLFDATQADAMVRYMVEGLPTPDTSTREFVAVPRELLSLCLDLITDNDGEMKIAICSSYWEHQAELAIDQLKTHLAPATVPAAMELAQTIIRDRNNDIRLLRTEIEQLKESQAEWIGHAQDHAIAAAKLREQLALTQSPAALDVVISEDGDIYSAIDLKRMLDDRDAYLVWRGSFDEYAKGAGKWDVTAPTPTPPRIDDAQGWRPISEWNREHGSHVIGICERYGIAEFLKHDDGWTVASFNGQLKRETPLFWKSLPPEEAAKEILAILHAAFPPKER